VAAEREIAMHKLCAVIKNFQQLKKTLTIAPLLHMFNANRVVIAVVASVKTGTSSSNSCRYNRQAEHLAVRPRQPLAHSRSQHTMTQVFSPQAKTMKNLCHNIALLSRARVVKLVDAGDSKS
jgi:hypothetical protein